MICSSLGSISRSMPMEDFSMNIYGPYEMALYWVRPLVHPVQDSLSMAQVSHSQLYDSWDPYRTSGVTLGQQFVSLHSFQQYVTWWYRFSNFSYYCQAQFVAPLTLVTWCNCTTCTSLWPLHSGHYIPPQPIAKNEKYLVQSRSLFSYEVKLIDK